MNSLNIERIQRDVELKNAKKLWSKKEMKVIEVAKQAWIATAIVVEVGFKVMHETDCK